MFSSKVDGVTTLLNLSFGDFIFIDSFPFISIVTTFSFWALFCLLPEIKDARSY